MAIRLVLGDDSDVLRTALRRFLSADPRIEIVGEGATTVETVAALKQFQPDVAVVDLRMQIRNGDFCDALRAALDGAGCVAISVAVDADARALAGRCGADYLVDKMQLGDDLIRAIVRSAERRRDAYAQ